MNEAQNYILLEGLRDWVALAEVEGEVRELLGDAKDDDVVRRAIVDAVTPLLHDGLVIPGSVTNEGFKPWSGSTRDLTTRYSSVVNSSVLDDPERSYAVWLCNTVEGDVVARQLAEQEASRGSSGSE